MGKTIFPIAGLSLLFLAGCYQPKEGCLDIRAKNYDVSADDPCPTCCTYPQLTIAFQHQVILTTQPDTFFSFRYNTAYPSPFDTSHYFDILRSRYFLSNFRLIRENGEAAGISDSIQIEVPEGVPVTVENNFTKVDRDIFQPSVIGKILANGSFRQIRFTLGLAESLLQTNPKSVPANHPLSIVSDTIIYKNGTGYIPNTLIFNPDTVSTATPLTFRFFEPKEITLDLPQPFELDKGFSVKLTLKINYMAWFEGIDLQNDSPLTMQDKLTNNLAKAFAVSGIVME